MRNSRLNALKSCSCNAPDNLVLQLLESERTDKRPAPLEFSVMSVSQRSLPPSAYVSGRHSRQYTVQVVSPVISSVQNVCVFCHHAQFKFTSQNYPIRFAVAPTRWDPAFRISSLYVVSLSRLLGRAYGMSVQDNALVA